MIVKVLEVVLTVEGMAKAYIDFYSNLKEKGKQNRSFKKYENIRSFVQQG